MVSVLNLTDDIRLCALFQGVLRCSDPLNALDGFTASTAPVKIFTITWSWVSLRPYPLKPVRDGRPQLGVYLKHGG